MSTDLRACLESIRIFDTHEHMYKEAGWLEFPCDIVQVLFHHYITNDLHVAGLRGAAFDRVFPKPAPGTKGGGGAPNGSSLAERWKILQPYWERCRHTGYGEAVRYTADTVFGLKEITLQGLEQAQRKLPELQRPGQRLKILQELAGLDHIQVDDFVLSRPVDASGPAFFLYDLSWAALCGGNVELPKLQAASGVTVKDLKTLKKAMETIFERHAPASVAVKTQHAYNRTLRWEERSDAAAQSALGKILKNPQTADADTKNCLGDWCWDQGARLCAQYNRPMKIHTGYYAGNDRMPLEFIEPGQMYKLLKKHLNTKFVLMHTAYPYGLSVLALCKHFQNVYADLCWAWSIDPYRTSDFVRGFLHAVPANKLFAFGGDTFLPTAAVGFAKQARRWMAYTLEQEIAAGWINEVQAIQFASQVLAGNQAECFDLEGTRGAVQASLAG